MKFFATEHRFDAPWSRVTLASWNKYPNDNSAHVLAVDIIDRHVDPATGILHTERLITCKQNLPSVMEWFVGKDAVAYIREISEVDPQRKTLALRSKNMTYSNLLTVEEICHYSEYEANVSTTKFMQKAIFSACGINISHLARKVEDTCVTSFAKNAAKGREGLEQVISRIQAETLDLAHALQDVTVAAVSAPLLAAAATATPQQQQQQQQ